MQVANGHFFSSAARSRRVMIFFGYNVEFVSLLLLYKARRQPVNMIETLPFFFLFFFACFRYMTWE
jgi:hypothetical protein